MKFSSVEKPGEIDFKYCPKVNRYISHLTMVEWY